MRHTGAQTSRKPLLDTISILRLLGKGSSRILQLPKIIIPQLRCTASATCLLGQGPTILRGTGAGAMFNCAPEPIFDECSAPPFDTLVPKQLDILQQHATHGAAHASRVHGRRFVFCARLRFKLEWVRTPTSVLSLLKHGQLKHSIPVSMACIRSSVSNTYTLCRSSSKQKQTTVGSVKSKKPASLELPEVTISRVCKSLNTAKRVWVALSGIKS